MCGSDRVVVEIGEVGVDMLANVRSIRNAIREQPVDPDVVGRIVDPAGG